MLYSVIAGYNGTIFAYGQVELVFEQRKSRFYLRFVMFIRQFFKFQTGSGKTFTITGGPERFSDRGIIPRSLSYIFQQFGQVNI